MIGKLLGHTLPSTTARYAHLAADPMHEAAELIGAELAGKMKGRKKKGARKKGKPASGKAPATPSAAAKAKDPLAGTWSGSLSGPQPLPEDGLDLVLEITKQDAEYACTLEVVGPDLSGVALKGFEGTHRVFPVQWS